MAPLSAKKETEADGEQSASSERKFLRFLSAFKPLNQKEETRLPSSAREKENGLCADPLFFTFTHRKIAEASRNAFSNFLSKLDKQQYDKTVAAIEGGLETGENFSLLLQNVASIDYFIAGFPKGADYSAAFIPIVGENPFVTSGDLLAEQADFPIWRRDSKGELTEFNAVFINLVGGEHAEDVRRKGLDLQTGGKSAVFARSVLEENVGKTVNVPVIHAGKKRVYKVRETPLYDTETGERGVFGYALDITAEQNAVDGAARTERGQKEILEGLRTAAAIFDSKRRLRFYNQSFAMLWELETAFLDGAPDYVAFIDKLRFKRQLPEQRDFKAWREAQLEIFRSAESEDYEEVWRLPDGRTLRVLLKPYPSGGLIAFFEDVTDRIRLERSYKVAADNLQESLNALHSGVALFDFYGRMKVSNKNVFLLGGRDKLTGTLPENCGFADLARFYQDKDAKIRDFWRDLARAAETGDAAKTFERLIVCAGGAYHYEARAEILAGGDILVTFTDVTAEYAARNALSEKADALIAASHVRDTFLKHLSYEMRAPMTAVIGFSEALQAEIFGALNGKQREYVGDIIRASQDLLHIIDNLLDLVRFHKDDSEVRASFAPINPLKLAQDAAALARRRFADKNFTVLYLSASDSFEISGDYTALRQAILQLTLNAFEAAPENGTVIFQIFSDNGRVRLSVRDNGAGVSPAVLQKINGSKDEDYTTEDFITGGVKKGAGFGLNFVKRVCKLHRAEFECASQERFGTSVSVLFPYAV